MGNEAANGDEIYMKSTSTSDNSVNRTHPKTSTGKFGSQVVWWKFDKESYLKLGLLKADEDPYEANNFNLSASNQLPPDRIIQDTRYEECKLVKITF